MVSPNANDISEFLSNVGQLLKTVGEYNQTLVTPNPYRHDEKTNGMEDRISPPHELSVEVEEFLSHMLGISMLLIIYLLAFILTRHFLQRLQRRKLWCHSFTTLDLTAPSNTSTTTDSSASSTLPASDDMTFQNAPAPTSLP